MASELKQLRIALVGIGGFGEHYLTQLLHLDSSSGAAFVAGIDAYPERCSKLTEIEAAGIPLYASLEAFYAQGHADLVIIAAPIHLHSALCCQALNMGSHVLLEKPLCARVEEAQSMLAAQKASGLLVGIGYQWSFSEPILELKKDILSGHLGKPLLMKSLILWPRPQSYFTRNSWAGRIKTIEGAWVLDSPLNNAMAHFLHNMFFLLGASMDSSAGVEDVYAELYRANSIENYDTAALKVISSCGTELRMYAAHPIHDTLDPQLSFKFEGAEVLMGKDQILKAYFPDGRIKIYGNPEAKPFEKIYRMLEAIRANTAPPCGILAALAHTECINRIQDFPVLKFPKERIRREKLGDDHLVWVTDLAKDFEKRFVSETF
ncbi:Gfo/Idh/MocA family oxidoreductase [Treponema sp.]